MEDAEAVGEKVASLFLQSCSNIQLLISFSSTIKDDFSHVKMPGNSITSLMGRDVASWHLLSGQNYISFQLPNRNKLLNAPIYFMALFRLVEEFGLGFAGC